MTAKEPNWPVRYLIMCCNWLVMTVLAAFFAYQAWHYRADFYDVMKQRDNALLELMQLKKGKP